MQSRAWRMAHDDIRLPSGSQDEKEVLLQWLDHLCRAVLRNLDGTEARWSPDGRPIPLVGVVRHPTRVEWGRIDGFSGVGVSRSAEECRPGPDVTLDAVVTACRERAHATDAMIRSLALTQQSKPDSWAQGKDLRWVVLHLINETARPPPLGHGRLGSVAAHDPSSTDRWQSRSAQPAAARGGSHEVVAARPGEAGPRACSATRCDCPEARRQRRQARSRSPAGRHRLLPRVQRRSHLPLSANDLRGTDRDCSRFRIARLRGGRPNVEAHSTRSNTAAIPCPPPMHIVSSPKRACRRCISRRSVVRIRQPVAPIG